MMVPWKALNGTHRRTSQCTWGEERKRWKLLAEEEREVTVRAFSAYGRPLEMVTSFKYLGRVISATDDNWPAVVRNLDPAKKVWSRMSRILSREGVTPWVYGFFFKAVIQAVLLFGAETWVVTPCMGKALGGFQTQVARQLSGKLPCEDNGRDVEIHLDGGSNGGGGVLDNGGICQAALEHGRTVYCYAITVRPM